MKKAETVSGGLAEFEKLTTSKPFRRLAEAEEKVRVAEERDLLVNLDAAWAEYKERAESLRIRFGGATYEVPSAMPAKFMLFFREHCMKKNTDGSWRFEITEGKDTEYYALLLGETFARAVLTSDLPFSFINSTICDPIMEAWGLGRADADSPETEKKTGPTPVS